MSALNPADSSVLRTSRTLEDAATLSATTALLSAQDTVQR